MKSETKIKKETNEDIWRIEVENDMNGIDRRKKFVTEMRTSKKNSKKNIWKDDE